MPRIFRAIGDEFNHRFSVKNTAPVNTFEGFNSRGEIIVRDRRGTLKAELPNVTEKSETLGSDLLAIYKPSGSKSDMQKLSTLQASPFECAPLRLVVLRCNRNNARDRVIPDDGGNKMKKTVTPTLHKPLRK